MSLDKGFDNIEQAGNTWYFKVGVTITNAYGAEYDTVAEGMDNRNRFCTTNGSIYVSN